MTRRRGFEDDLDAELAAHLDARADDLVRDRGLTPEAARRQARLEFGSIASYREQAREAAGLRWLDDLRQDVRGAARGLAAHPAFAITAVTTIALAVGVTTAVFGAVNALVLRPLPFADPDRLVQILGTSPTFPDGEALGRIDEYRRASTTFDAIAGYDVGAQFLGGADGPARLVAVRTEADFFRLLRVAPIRGRIYSPDDGPDVAVVSEAWWRRQLDGDQAVIGRRLVVNDRSLTVVGVMDAAFGFPYGAASLLPGVATEAPPDIWTPFPEPPARLGTVLGRLKPDVSEDAALNDLQAIAARLAAEFPETNARRSVRLLPLSATVVSPPVRRVLFLLFAAAVLVLALACATLANLALVRAVRRQRELCLRQALGAGRSRLVRQFMVEGGLLSMAGGAAGLLVAWWGGLRLAALASARLPRAHEASIDWHVVAFVLVACLATTLVTGAAPLVLGTGGGDAGRLTSLGSWSTMSRRQQRVRDSLVVSEIALACLLAIGASMLVRELVRLRGVGRGIATEHVLTIHMSGVAVLARGPVPDEGQTRQYYDIADRVAGLPGVVAAGFTQLLPLQNWGWTSTSTDFRPAGLPPPDAFPIEMRYVTPGFFAALGIPIREGRTFEARDTATSPRVVVINETLARRYFGADSPIGVATNRGTIVGVAGDVRQVHLGRPAAPELYFPVAQNWSQLSELGMTLVVRTGEAVPAGTLAAAIRDVVGEISPGQTVFNARTMDTVVADSLADLTLFVWLMLIFMATALALAAAGTYGVIAFAATARAREFAVRLAMGATGAGLGRLVVGQALRLSAVGVAAGVAAAVALTPLLDALPMAIAPPGAGTILPVALLMAVIAAGASAAPARRAAHVDPMTALRCE